MSEPAILYGCPGCGRVFDSPSVCSADGVKTVAKLFLIPTQHAPKLPASTPDDGMIGTCDWGHCDEEAVAWRWWRDGGVYLSVCMQHRSD